MNFVADAIDLRIDQMSGVVSAIDVVVEWCRTHDRPKVADVLMQVRSTAVAERDEFVAAIEVVRKQMGGPALLTDQSKTEKRAPQTAAILPRKTRPAGIPTNVQMVRQILTDRAPLTAAQIVAEMRRRWWPDMPTHNMSTIYGMDLARDGKRFSLKEAPRETAADEDDDEKELRPAVQPIRAEPPKPAAPPPPPPAPAAPQQARPNDEVAFRHRDKVVGLTTREWRMASHLLRAMGRGALPPKILAEAMWKPGERMPHDIKGTLSYMRVEIGPKLAKLGLALHADQFGYYLTEEA